MFLRKQNYHFILGHLLLCFIGDFLANLFFLSLKLINEYYLDHACTLVFTLIADGMNLTNGFLSGRQTPTNFRSVILYKLGRHLVHGIKLLWFLKNRNKTQGIIHSLYISLACTWYHTYMPSICKFWPLSLVIRVFKFEEKTSFDLITLIFNINNTDNTNYTEDIKYTNKIL